MNRATPPLLLVALVLLLPACGSSGGRYDPPPPVDPCEAGSGTPLLVSGTVWYERLALGPTGLGPAIETRPARFVDVRVRLAGGGTCYGETSTDAFGAYLLTVRPPDGSALEVWAYSRTDHDPLRRVVVHEGLAPNLDQHTSADTFGHPSTSFTAVPPGGVDVTVPYNPGTSSRPSIGFGLLDVLVSCADALRAATGTVPPTCHAYTELGNNGSVGTSFFSPSSGSLTILGGAAGNLDGSDTDYFDDAVIAHEFFHFVEFRMSHSLSRGGPHSGEELEPGFSWSEGQATGFGSLCREDASYVDSEGTSGGTFISTTVENWPQSVRGIGGEESVAEIVWDLGDGRDGIPDVDGDVAAVARTQLLAALLTFEVSEDAPYLGLFLDRLVGAAAITGTDVATLLATPENQQIGYPLTGDDVWPIPLSVPGSASGLVDSTAGVDNPCRALAASRWYHFELTSTTSVTLDLQITSTPPSGDNLNLYLLQTSGTLRAQSVQVGGADESVGPISLGPGHWLVRVEADCAGAGNRASFTLVAGN